ncbi:MAG: hypothetical protein M1820_000666 [Bogoriella megaspora]|nr:MAG: hypothetical protein M1820_000666 [Bogoriella megaspora]
MPLPLQTTGPAEEKPSLSETSPPVSSTTADRLSNIGSTIGGSGNGAANGGNTVKGDAEIAAEKLYEERMEEEYAKREGGA